MEATLVTRQSAESEVEERVATSPGPVVLSTAELAACTCPDWCERDHDRD